jgi:SPX domain protein involved in polyphosphate accumulation
MKFAHNLPRNQVPEWASLYINYKGLKKLIKTAAAAVKDGEDPDLAGKYLVPLRQPFADKLQSSSFP